MVIVLVDIKTMHIFNPDLLIATTFNLGVFYFIIWFLFFGEREKNQVKESNLTNPFNANFERKMYVYPTAHKLCEKGCSCKKVEAWVKFPNIIDKKEKDFCQRHQLKFDNECHKLPSGNLKWIGCPVCYKEDQKVAHRRDFIMFMKDSGMRHNDDKDEWFKPELPGEKKEEYTPIAKRRIV